jgi:hypothetical protein
MKTRQARKLIPHRFADCLACMKWHRFKRLHLASNLLTELCTIVQQGSRVGSERVLMISLKSAILSKDQTQMVEVFNAWKENLK